MREHLVKQKEERRNRIQGKVTKINESKQNSDEEDEVESEKVEKNKEEELDVSFLIVQLSGKVRIVLKRNNAGKKTIIFLHGTDYIHSKSNL